jgi:exodeoxyribonuclease VII large subunit
VVLKRQGELQHVQDLLISETQKQLFKEQERLKLNENAIRLLNPGNVLKRGFTLTLKNGKIIKSVNDVESGEELTTKFADGQVKSKITKKIR